MPFRWDSALILYGVVCCFFQEVKVVKTIGCFVCTSFNHNNPDCEDNFNNTDNKFYKEECWAGRRDRLGLFPGTECVKMIANDEKSGFSLTVRDCVVDNGGTNEETELGRQSHCGWMREIEYNGRRMRGCILSCSTDACNMGVSLLFSWKYTLFAILFLSAANNDVIATLCGI
ncbi:hypothetical protein ACJMK2_006726 [Sinanodonta woodiana]|uniref:Protein quiver n=1 Tax=Sinanodonta woodiana TaxID=1069815 RepID=A0ABD3VU21_SINWO